MTNCDFATLIISHGRPQNILTLSSLTKAGYTGQYYIIVDDQDKSVQEYKQNYGNNVVVFNKQHYLDSAISFNLEPLVNVAVHARNAAEDIAVQLGLKYFLLLDDDIINFQFKYNQDGCLNRIKAFDIDNIISMYIKYMEDANITTLGLAHDGYFLGGNINMFTLPQHSRYRLLANAFLRKVSEKVVWSPDMCEDFITSILENRKQNVWISLPFLSCSCKVQGMNKKKVDGGNSNVYIEQGNYGVAIYSVLNLPDCYRLKISKKLWFECVDYNLTMPKIISSRYRKVD